MVKIPEELRARPQWVLWRGEKRDGKPTKVPYALNGKHASTTDQSTWGTYDQVTEAFALHDDLYSGVGYVFAKDDPYVGVDLDGAIENGALTAWAERIIQSLDTYCETSPSGTGIHAFLRALLRSGKGRKNGHIEVYSEGRYFTVTGNHLSGTPTTINARQEALDRLYDETFEKKHEEEDEAIALASRARNKLKFSRLWKGDITGYKSSSEADLALVSILAFYTGPDRERLDRLFRRSGLMREKWDQSSGEGSYGERTITKALEGMTEFYGEKKKKEGGGTAIYIICSTVKKEPLIWTWPERIPQGKVTLIVGDAGLGKSLLTLDMAARITMGGSWPDRPGEKIERRGVVHLQAEDDLADTVVWRLEAAGADCSLVASLIGVKRKDGTRDFVNLATDLAAVEEAIHAVKAGLVIIDPISAYLGSADADSNSAMRGIILGPLAELASRNRVAIAAITHRRKAAGPAMQRAIGSIAFVAVARASWLVAQDPKDENVKLFLPLKNNLAPKGTGLSFRTIPGTGGFPVLSWDHRAVTVTADEIEVESGPQEAPTRREEAKAFLLEALKSGPKRSKKLDKEAEEAGIALRTLRRAKDALGVLNRFEADDREEGKMMWTCRLPVHSGPYEKVGQEGFLGQVGSGQEALYGQEVRGVHISNGGESGQITPRDPGEED